MERLLWIYNLSRLDLSYIPEVYRFIDAAKNHASWRTKMKHIYYPCIYCKNIIVFDDTKQITSHLVYREFMKDYLIWTNHGEGSSASYITTNPKNIDADGADMIANKFLFIHETQQPLPHSEHVVPNVMYVEDAEFLEGMLHRHTDPDMLLMKGMETLRKAAEEPLYDESKGCIIEFMMLRSMLKLLVLKARYALSDVDFEAFLSIIVDMLPKENKVPANMYYTKKLISPLTMGVEKIHTCRNHCILYRGDEYKDLKSCPKCSANRYKTNKDYREEECAAFRKKRKKTQKNNQQSSKPNSKEKEVDYYAQKKISALVMWYLPVVDQLRCLFAKLENAKLMSWHASDEHKK